MTKEKLIKELIDEGYLKSPILIEAFQTIDRAKFVPEEREKEAYGNYPLPIGHGQTISQPLTVAFMLELLEPKKGEKILDVGSGSGWQTALLAHIVGKSLINTNGKLINADNLSASISQNRHESVLVVAIERIPELASIAEKNIGKFGFIEKGIVKVVTGDGSLGYETEMPFDKIIAAAAGDEIPIAWKEQLKVGGRIVAPLKQSVHLLIKKSKEEFEERVFFGFNFVPLVTKD